ncbi:hypothetical protein [Sphingobium baderi]|uniref:hypothetical protein n=1 Tax=Sphingobium baderi TaxID=1332080 RepID=UPI0003F688FE|nr:hypothetical protein [Sphingobium baderi]
MQVVLYSQHISISYHHRRAELFENSHYMVSSLLVSTAAIRDVFSEFQRRRRH